jgi:hypothetical protein
MTIWIIRGIGALNVFFGVTGLGYFAIMIGWRWSDLPRVASNAWFLFLLLSSLSTLLVGVLVYMGVRLLRKDEAAVRGSAIAFGGEIFYFLAYVVVFWLVLPLHGAAWQGPPIVHMLSVVQGPLAPQIITGYPVFGLVVTLILARRRAAPTL